MFSLRKFYNYTSSFVFNLFHNNGLLNLIDLCDKHGYRLILESIINISIRDSYNNKYDSLRTKILDNFNNIENYSNETFKDKFNQFIQNNRFDKFLSDPYIRSVHMTHPFILTLITLISSKYYINGFIEDKVLYKFNLLKEEMSNNVYLMEEDNNKLFNEMSLTSKNRKILLFMKNVIIDYIISIFETIINDNNINGLNKLDDLNTNELLSSFNDTLNRLNKELEESIELYNKERNE